MERNERYDYYKKNHPDWSDEQIWMAISIDLKAKDTVKYSNGDVDLHDESIMISIIEGARQWLNVVLPDVYEKVKTWFDTIIKSIGRWIQKGLNYLLDELDKIAK